MAFSQSLFLDRLDFCCNERGIKPSVLAVQILGSKSNVSNWRKGTAPSVQAIVSIADYFAVSVDYLIGLTDDPSLNRSGDDLVEDSRESSLLAKLRASDSAKRDLVLRMADMILEDQQVAPPPFPFVLPNDGISRQSRRPNRSRGTKQDLKRVEGKGAAGAPIATVAEDDLAIFVPAKYTGDNFFIVCAQGDSMTGDGIESGDFCVFQSDAYRDEGTIMYVQVDGATDLPDGAIKRVFFHSDQVELRSANPAYAPMFYPANEVSLNGVLVTVIPSEGRSSDDTTE